ncbi:alpha/beta hydrolase [Thalassospira mesophila]|uniref:alpha/beta hydrolase n=1 Tax=Thalassospira mesophila TaxID=1293891 RepID=UPI001FE58773|nr:alpha/beta hydrolase [Thalassospira mesophila]
MNRTQLKTSFFPNGTINGAGAVIAVMLLLMAGCAPSLRPAGAPMATISFMAGDQAISRDTPPTTPSFFRTIDGTLLAMQRWLPVLQATTPGALAGASTAAGTAQQPPDTPDAVILGLHGFGDYANGFAEAGEQLARLGVAVYAYDQRGFGRSPTRGFWPGPNSLVQDASDALTILHSLYPGTPVYLTGVSMGAAVAIITAASRPQLLDGVILVSPAVWDRADMPWYQTMPLAVLSHSLPWLPVSGRGLEIWPSDNIEMLRRLSRDSHMLSSVRVDMVAGVADLMDMARLRAGDLHVPVLVMSGRNDQVIPPAVMASFVGDLPAMANKGRRDKGSATICVYQHGYHMLLRDLNGPKVIDDLADWVFTGYLENADCHQKGLLFDRKAVIR